MKNTIQKIQLLLLLIFATHSAIFSQCTTVQKDSMNALVTNGLQAVKPILLDKYQGDWFKLLDDEQKLSEATRSQLTTLRSNVVFALTCDVSDNVKAIEIEKRKAFAGNNATSGFLNVKPVKAKFGGSSSFSSDIDVNLKGDGTEYAVRLINERFHEKFESQLESGEMFDINFYAKDFVPAVKRIEKESEKFIEDDSWREYVFQSEEYLKKDIEFQTLLSMIFMKKNMGKADFSKYEKAANTPILAGMIEKRIIPSSLFEKVNAEFELYESRISKESGNSQMARENRAYERLLESAADKRITFEWKKATDADNLDNAYFEWKKAKTYGTLHANEAHCTAGAIVHVVANKQILAQQYNTGDKKFMKLKLTEHELYQSFNEQIGFAFHKLNHTNSEGDVIKLGKYMHRAYNALKHFHRASGLPVDYTQSERLAATDWEGLKKGLKRDAAGKFTIKVTDKRAEMNKILFFFNERFVNSGLGNSIGTLDNIPELKENFKTFLIHLKVQTDRQYFGKNYKIYTDSFEVLNR